MLTRMGHHLRRGGWRGVADAVVAKVLRRPVSTLVRVPGARRSVRVRLRTSDLWTYDEIFERREYDVPLPADTRVIIDAGANIGLASVYFALRFPEARILALEPEEANFRLLRRNTEPYPNIEPIQAALWHHETRLDLEDPERGAWGYRVAERSQAGAEPSGTQVAAVTVPGLLDARGLEHVDVLKVDIEGAEADVFAHAGAWIHRVRAVIVELHEDLAPGCSDAYEAAVADFPHRWTRGENQVAAREDHPWPASVA